MSSDHKKYQVFVSSTFHDLQEERQEIMHALLELDCIPAGMELFPAANEDQWSLIKGVIDDCDYYIVVLAGRYGSIGPDGLSYTEMEYRYAVEIGRPVIAFVHGDPNSIVAGNCEATDEGREKLRAFYDLVQKKMCKQWTSAKDLGSVVSRSLIMLQKKHPGVGWVRGDQVPSKDAASEILSLRKQVDALRGELDVSRTSPPEGSARLSQGEELFNFQVKFRTRKDGSAYEWDKDIPASWDELFFVVSPLLLHEATTHLVHDRLTEEIQSRVSREFDKTDEEHAEHWLIPSGINVSRTDLETAIVQFLALGLIERSTRKNRSVNDRGDYWTLTPYGFTVMNQLRAIPATTS